MASLTLPAIVNPVNSANFSALPGAASQDRDADPFEPLGDEQCDAYVEAQYRGARVEWRRNGSGRTIGGDARLPRQWLPFAELHAAIKAVPYSESMRRGLRIARELWWGYDACAREWGFALETNRAGEFQLRVSPEITEPWGLRPPGSDPYYPLEPVGAIVYRTRDIRSISAYLSGLAEAEKAYH